MKSYYRIMLGQGSKFAAECFAGNFIGANFDIHQDLSGKLPDDWRAFNKEFIPILPIAGIMEEFGAGLRCGFLWTVSKGIQKGDIVLCPDGSGRYRVGEVAGDYYYQPDGALPHRRPVHWLSQIIDRSDMSEALRNSTGAIGTVSNTTRYSEEIERLIGGCALPTIISTDSEVEDASAFAMEKHLEDFFLLKIGHRQIWGRSTTSFRKKDGEKVGQQYPADKGAIDILTVSKDKKTLLVIELKKGRASDVVVRQTLRYMGYVQEELADVGQIVRGVIIALGDDQKIRRALAMVPTIKFYRYQINFKLVKG